MRRSYHSAFGGTGIRRSGDDQPRPIASSLKLGDEHVNRIDQSHERCSALGISRIQRPDLAPLGRSDLTVARERNLRLYEHAAPVMEMLYEQTVNTHSMVLLTDATGTVLHTIGDDDFLGRANKVALSPGVNWSESTKGTNAIGTALVEETPVLVHADEHYLHANQFLTCSAAPILDPRGNILGVLDVSGDHRGYHQHTMALVKMSARMIENHWLSDDYRHAMRLHFHSRVEFIGTLMEGILAVSPDGKLVGANRGALEQLGMSGAALRMHTLTTLFGTTVNALVDRFRSPLATPMPVQHGSGQQFHIYARFNWPIWSSLSEAASQSTRSTLRPSQGDASGVGDEAVAGARTVPPGSGEVAARAPGSETGTGLAQLRTGDPQVASVIDKVSRVLDHDIPILVLGETGTGKELLVRAIHHDSARAKQPFVAVNCASIPESLIEAELFGYEDGAFTGARRKGQVGKIVQANGGTLFLDEIGDMPISLQAHLLRVLQERQVTPLGSTRSVAVDVTIICATHRNLREMIDTKLFREDLFYRLNGLAVRLPPLRERSDLDVLVRRILDQLTSQGPHPRRLEVGDEVMRLFERYSWPGNVRQLFNVLRTAAVMAAGGRVITREHLSDDFVAEAQAHLRQESASRLAGAGLGAAAGSAPAAPAPDLSAAEDSQRAPADPVDADEGQTTGDARPARAAPAARGWSASGGADQIRSLEEQEIETIAQAVELAGGNISEASKRLGISRNTIYRKLRWRKQEAR